MKTLRCAPLWIMALTALGAVTSAAPNKFLLHNPFEMAELSPGGSSVALTERSMDGKMTVSVVDTASFKADPFHVSDGKGGQGEVTSIRWVDDQRLAILSRGDGGGDWLSVFEVGSNFPTRVAKEGRRTLVSAIAGTSRFLVAERPETDSVGPCRLVEYDAANVDASPKTIYECASKSFECVVDQQGRLRLAKKTDESGANEAWHRVDPADGSWTKLALNPWIRVYGMDGDSARALVGGHLEGQHPGIFVYDTVADKTVQLLADHPEYAIDRYGKIVFDRRSGRAVGLDLDTSVYASFWTDPALKTMQETVDAKLAGSVNRIRQWDLDRNVLLVERIFPMLPGQYFLVDLKADRFTAIAHCGGKVLPSDVGPTKLVEIPNRDGVPLDAILTLPAKRDPGKLPLLVWIRPGLWAGVDRVEWHREANFFASEGYAVLRINYSGGEGMIGPLVADTNSKDGVMRLFRDIDDAVQALVEVGVADPARLAIGGEGAAAWAAAYAPIANPGRYQAALCFNGAYDLAALHDEKTGNDAGPGINLNFARHYSSMSLSDIESFSVTPNISEYPKHVFVCSGKWSPIAYKNQVTEYVKRLKKSGVSAKVMQENWYGSQLSGIARHDAFSMAAAVLKSAFK